MSLRKIGPYRYHEKIGPLVVNALDETTGWGLCTHRGHTIRVPRVWIGETIFARVYRAKPKSTYVDADLLNVRTASPRRVNPACSFFNEGCNGCQFQHISLPAQREAKKEFVERALSAQNLDSVKVSPVEGDRFGYSYRSKLTPHFDVPRMKTSQKKDGVTQVPDVGIGFKRVGRKFGVIDVNDCKIARRSINLALPELRQRTQKKVNDGFLKRGATLLLRDTDQGVLTDSNSIASATVNDRLKVTFRAGDFFVRGFIDLIPTCSRLEFAFNRPYTRPSSKSIQASRTCLLSEWSLPAKMTQRRGIL